MQTLVAPLFFLDCGSPQELEFLWPLLVFSKLTENQFISVDSNHFFSTYHVPDVLNIMPAPRDLMVLISPFKLSKDKRREEEDGEKP